MNANYCATHHLAYCFVCEYCVIEAPPGSGKTINAELLVPPLGFDLNIEWPVEHMMDVTRLLLGEKEVMDYSCAEIVETMNAIGPQTEESESTPTLGDTIMDDIRRHYRPSGYKFGDR